MRKRWLAAGVAIVAAAAVALGVLTTTPGGRLANLVAGKVAQPAAAASAPLEFRTSEVVTPVRTTMPRRIEISGALVAPGTAIVRARTAGSVLALDLREGDRVARGQVMARIDVNELGNRIAERQANVESARAALAQAERSHASNARLAAQSFISPIALDNSRAQLDSARAALAAAQASLETSKVGLRDATPIAPIAGIIAKRHVLPGERVSFEQPLFTIVDLRRLELAGQVGTHEVASLSAGMPVTVRVEGLEQPVAGTVARIAPAADAGTRSIGVTIALDNPAERLRAGQYAVASVLLADDRQRLALPGTAVSSQAGQSQVWVIDQGVLSRRTVVTGRVDEAHARVEVVSGLSEDAQVLAARYDNLREGARALVLAAQAPLASAAAKTPAMTGVGAAAVR